MSNIYIQEPPTLGKVCIETSVGDIEIELWARECPKACRNFVQLCMENYYNKTKFHRVVKDFIVQGGDPSGTGEGGESVYGHPFKDEIHSRLRFVRRGLVAMANAGKDDNGSQFFFTMGPTQELQNKHTIFGKVVGDTIYNMVKLQECEVGPDDKPVYAPKIKATKVLINPFDDIVPRTTIKMLTDEEDKKPKSKMKATKDFKLLSFGDEAEEDADDLESVQQTFVGKAKSSHDLLNDPKLLPVAGIDDDKEEDKGPLELVPESKVEPEMDIDNIRDKLKRKKADKSFEPERYKKKRLDSAEEEEEEDEATAQKRRKEEIKKEIRALKREMLSDGTDKSEVKEKNPPKESKLREEDKSNDMLASYHAEQDKYASKAKAPKKGSSAREAMTLAILAKFKNKLSTVKEKGEEEKEEESEEIGDDWMAHTLKFESDDPVLAKDANTKTDDWFDIYDPRNPLNKRRRQADKKK